MVDPSQAFTFRLGFDASKFKTGVGEASASAGKLTDQLDKTEKAARDSLGRFLPKGAKESSQALGEAAKSAGKLGDQVAAGAKKGQAPVTGLSKSAQRLADRIDAAAAKGARGFGGIGRAARSARTPVESLGGAIGRMGSSILGFAAASAVGLAIRSVVNETLALEKAMAEVATLVDTTRVPIQQITADARTMAAVFGVNGVEATKALYQAISAGVDPTRAVMFLKDAATLATAGLAELKETTDLLTNALNAYGISVDKAGALSDVFFSTVKDGKTTIPELSASIGQVAPIAASAGVSIYELAAAVAALTSTGLSTADSMGGVRAALTAILNPTNEARVAAERLGIDFSASALATKGMAEFLRDLKGALESAAQQGEDTTEIVGQLFGKVHASNAIISLAGKQWDKFSTSLENNKKSAGAADEAAKKVSKTFGHQMKVAMEVAKDEAGKLGAEVTKALGELLEFGGGAEGVTTVLRALGLGARGAFQLIAAVAASEFHRATTIIDGFILGVMVGINTLKAGFKQVMLLKEKAAGLVGLDNEVATRRLENEIQSLYDENAALTSRFSNNRADRNKADSARFDEATKNLAASAELLLRGATSAASATAAAGPANSAGALEVDRAGAVERAQIREQKAREKSQDADEAAARERLKQQQSLNDKLLINETAHGRQRISVYERESLNARGVLGGSLSRAYRGGIGDAQPALRDALRDALSGAQAGIRILDSNLSTPYQNRDQVRQGLFNSNATAAEKAVNISALARGVYGFSSGGMVPGAGRGDTVPAMLEPGEIVIRRDAAQQNRAALLAMNSGAPARFQSSGSFEGAASRTSIANIDRSDRRSSASSTTTNQSTSDNRRINNNFNINAATDPKKTARMVMKEIERRQRLGLT